MLDKITDSEQRRWYAETCQKTAGHGMFLFIK
ncbi:MAG: hypothetical protein UE643_03905 [Gemmiger sp.]|nr:hypothetical protein [Gemmiger sp.]